VTALPASVTADVFIDAPVTLPNDLDVTGSVTVNGTQLTLGGRTLAVSGDVGVQGAAGRVIMTDVADVLDVEGNVSFDGASESAYLTMGQMRIAGSLTVGGTYSTLSFAPTVSHLVVLDGSGSQGVTFVSPGTAAQRFAGLRIDNTDGAVTFFSDAFVTGTLATAATSTTLAGSGGAKLRVTGRADLDGATFDGLPLELVSPFALTSADHTLDALTFQNMDPSVTQLYIRAPGGGAPSFQVSQPQFLTTPIGGLYLDVATTNATTMAIDLFNPTPLDGSALSLVGALTTVNWINP
jgi:hypothetical protein